MKILHIIPSMNPDQGGVCQVIRDNVPAMEALGAHGEVLSFDAPDAEFLIKDPFPIHAIGPAKGPYSYCPNLDNWLSRNIEKYDILLVHGLWLHNDYGTFRFWSKFKKQTQTKAPHLFIMPHGMLDPYFQKASGRKLKAIRNTVFWKLIENKAVNGADGLLFTCEQEMLLARKPFKPYHPRKELNVGLGTTAPPLFRDNFNEGFVQILPMLQNQPYWLFLSRIHPKKGVDLLLEAYLKLADQHPKLPALVIAGPGLDTEFGKKMKSLGNHPKIHFPGMLTGDTKWGAFYGCEAFVLPSHQENFGIAVAEAMACRKPVLISYQVNIWREIDEGEGGLVFADTVQGTHTALTNFLRLTPGARAKMGENAYTTYKSHFSIEKAAQNMIDQLNLATDEILESL